MEPLHVDFDMADVRELLTRHDQMAANGELPTGEKPVFILGGTTALGVYLKTAAQVPLMTLAVDTDPEANPDHLALVCDRALSKGPERISVDAIRRTATRANALQHKWLRVRFGDQHLMLATAR